jgi:hypothetical protein
MKALLPSRIRDVFARVRSWMALGPKCRKRFLLYLYIHLAKIQEDRRKFFRGVNNEIGILLF